MTALQAAPGVVLAVWAGPPLLGNLIRAGEALAGKEAVANHVVIVTHQDARGRWMGIAGQPGGVGLADCTPYLADPRTRGNYAQPRPDDHGQLAVFLASCAKSLGVGYDWAGIGEDLLGALHLNDLADGLSRVYRWQAPHGLMPGEFVCSSLAWWQYDNAGWAHPAGSGEMSEPADWWTWCDQELWKVP